MHSKQASNLSVRTEIAGLDLVHSWTVTIEKTISDCNQTVLF